VFCYLSAASGSKVLNITTPGGRVIATTTKASNVVTVNPKTLQLTAVKSNSGGTTGNLCWFCLFVVLKLLLYEKKTKQRLFTKNIWNGSFLKVVLFKRCKRRKKNTE
jgi:L-asparagine transporter-like permease